MIDQMDRRLVFGIGLTWADNVNNPPPDYDQQMAARLVAAHCQSTRMGFSWDMIEPDYPGQGLWALHDYRVNLIAAQGIDIVGLIVGTPWWAKSIDVSSTVTAAWNAGGKGYLEDTSAPFGQSYANKYDVKITSGGGAGQVRRVESNTTTTLTLKSEWDAIPEPGSAYILGGHAAFVLPQDTPSNRDALRNFCASLTSRYLGKIRYFEFWNEPDYPDNIIFDVAEYTSWLPTPYQGVKQGNANALLSVGGLLYADAGYLQGIYNNGGQPYFDAVAVHPYAPDYIGPINFDSINGKRGVMAAHGDGAKSMWLTEYGWPVNDADPQSLINQANWLLESLQTLWTPAYYFVTQANYHIIADHEKPGLVPFGLCKADLTPRPAYYTFQSYASPRTPKAYSLAPFVTQVI